MFKYFVVKVFCWHRKFQLLKDFSISVYLKMKKEESILKISIKIDAARVAWALFLKRVFYFYFKIRLFSLIM